MEDRTNNKKTSQSSLKPFLIKLISVSFAIIIVISILFRFIFKNLYKKTWKKKYTKKKTIEFDITCI